MRSLTLLVLIAAAAAQSIQLQNSHSTESFRGVSAISRQVTWVSGTHGTYVRTTNGGRTWMAAQVPEATALDFRGVVAFSADEAFLMSSGPGEQSRIYHTADAGKHWRLQFTNSNPKGFFDSIAFWDPQHGIVLGDPVADESGKLKFELLATDDGEHWHEMSRAHLPEAVEGEGAFAASNRCIAMLPDRSGRHIWFATGGKTARVFHSADGGEHWEVASTPLIQGPESAGIFSIAFLNHSDGMIAGGDYKRPEAEGPNLAFTHDGGKTWELAPVQPQAFFSAAAYDLAAIQAHGKAGAQQMREEFKGTKGDAVAVPIRTYLVLQHEVLDIRFLEKWRRLAPKKRSEGTFNAIAPIPEGGAFVVGSKGIIAVIR